MESDSPPPCSMLRLRSFAATERSTGLPNAANSSSARPNSSPPHFVFIRSPCFNVHTFTTYTPSPLVNNVGPAITATHHSVHNGSRKVSARHRVDLVPHCFGKRDFET